jgi:hypothetical protein
MRSAKAHTDTQTVPCRPRPPTPKHPRSNDIRAGSDGAAPPGPGPPARESQCFVTRIAPYLSSSFETNCSQVHGNGPRRRSGRHRLGRSAASLDPQQLLALRALGLDAGRRTAADPCGAVMSVLNVSCDAGVPFVRIVPH